MLGDPDDVRTPFKLQRMFVERAKAHGNHAIAIEVKAEGERLHGVAHLALPVAASCMRGEPDREIIAAATKTPVRPVPPELGPKARGAKGAVRETLRDLQ